MSENTPLTILQRMNNIDKQNLNGNYKKEIVLQGILNNNDNSRSNNKYWKY